MKQLLIFGICLIGFFGELAAQLHCGTDEMHQQLFQQHPEYNAEIQLASEQLKAFTEQFIQSPPKSGATYIIPVVFHIIHNYGVENISDAQIHDAIKQVNLQYRKLNADTSEIVSAFQSIAADAQIEIRLAQLDPDGNCTSGITRTPSLLTYTGDHSVKSLVHWPPDKYLNIYVCIDAAGLAGHSLLPADAEVVPNWDGIVMQHSYVGTIGTSEFFRRTVLSHEIGHYLNLQHIWGGNNVPGYPYLPVGDAGNCAYDDDVLDTPNTIGWSTCNLNAQSCSSLDNVQNYMDYAYCARMFTEGQKLRMHAALNSPIANRDNLWSPANLAATGTNDLTNYLCAVKFEAAKQVICAGDTVDFTDLSYHGVTNRLWNFEGGTALDLTAEITTVSYPTEGTYDVTLEVSNGIDTLELTLTDYITVLPATGSLAGLNEDCESEPTFQSKWIVNDFGQPFNWEFAPVGFASNQSLFINNYEAGESKTYDFYSKPIDASGLTTYAVAFDWAFAQRDSVSTPDVFRVLISNNCGETWVTKKSYNGISTLKSVTSPVYSPFIPLDETEWNSDTVIINGASNLTDHLLVKFYFIGKGGNNFYLDNIRIGHPAALGLGIDPETGIHVFPNPSNNELNVQWNQGIDAQEICLINTSGQVVKSIRIHASETAHTIDLTDVSSGYYIVVVKSELGEKRIPQTVVK